MGLDYKPKQGNICYLNFSPTKGHEQNGYRPALIISGPDFNNLTNLIVVCPISSNIKRFPTHYILKNTKKINGALLCEYIRSTDYNARKLTYVESLNDEELYEVIDIINGIIEKELNF